MRADRESAACSSPRPGAAPHRERLIVALASVMHVSGFCAGNRVSALPGAHTGFAKIAVQKWASGKTKLT